MGLKFSIVGVPCVKKEIYTQLHTHTGRRSCGDGGRDWSDAKESTSQRIPRTASNHKKLKEKHGNGFSQIL